MTWNVTHDMEFILKLGLLGAPTVTTNLPFCWIPCTAAPSSLPLHVRKPSSQKCLDVPPKNGKHFVSSVCVFFDFQTWELVLNFHRLSIRQNLNLHNSASPSTLCAATRRKASSNFLQHGSAGPPNLLISKLGALKKLLVPYLKRPCRIGRVHNFEISCYHEDMKASSFKSDSRNISGKILPSSVSSLI